MLRVKTSRGVDGRQFRVCRFAPAAGLREKGGVRVAVDPQSFL
jgi:hypothetical protein